jgi:hypothetical protein
VPLQWETFVKLLALVLNLWKNLEN